jgi:ribonuclease BN (tRNA processing enzyme)
MRSPRFAPAGLLVEAERRVMLDGGPGSVPEGTLDAWLVTDERAELMARIRALAQERGLAPEVGGVHAPGLDIVPLPVVHTSRPTYGYLISADHLRIAWAPEFLQFPDWANGADLMFADAAGWDRPIRFAGGVGGHAAARQVAVEAQRHGVRRLVFAHLGRPTIRAMDAGQRPAFGRFGHDGQVFRPRRWRG